MNDLPDELNREIRRLRSLTPVPERASLTSDLLAVYDREFSPVKAPISLRRWAASLAAAALVVAAFLLGSRVPDSDPVATFQPAGPDLALLDARIELLKARLMIFPGPVPARTPEPDPEPEWSSESRLLALGDRDPALFRLASARAFESISPQMAAGRYRQLLNDYSRGPAADVARNRLAFLNQ